MKRCKSDPEEVFGFILKNPFRSVVFNIKHKRPLLSEKQITEEMPLFRHFFPIGYCQSCDQNTAMAASAAVRTSMGLTLRLSRVIPDCSTCPLYRLKSCVNSSTSLQRRGSFDSFRTINRHLQTTIGE